MSTRIALAGNPNCGKTTMFNCLTGSNQRVGNWPGVTVEKKEGKLKGYPGVVITDLPGIYSLSPYTLEEVISRDYLLDEKPDAIINLVDATNIERNLYLTTQLIEIGIPVVVALNMIDLSNKSGDKIDTAKLSRELGCPVVETSALKNKGVLEAAKAAIDVSAKKALAKPMEYTADIEGVLEETGAVISAKVRGFNLRWFSVKAFENDEKAMERLALSSAEIQKVASIRKGLEDKLDDDSESIITNARYEYISTVVAAGVKKGKKGLSTSDKIDRIVTNRFLALPIFVLVMFLVYYISISTVGDWATGWTNDVLFGEIIPPAVEGWLVSVGAADWLVGLIVEGIIGGVGGVLGFVPQMLILFLMLCILEDCGYMARVAFIMDRIFRRFGLSGKSFIPMLIGVGCGVPGIMASRTIERESDRKMTIMTTTFIPCGAKMPIVALIAGALFGGAWWVAPSAYFIGVAAILVSGIILKKTRWFAGDAAPFVMELPAYHGPKVSNVLRSTWERGWSFIKRAGTVILLASILIWFTSTYGWTDGVFGAVEDIDLSMLGIAGTAIAGVFAPLGFGSWQATVATILGLVAKEEVVGAMGTMAAVAGDALEMVEEGQFAGVTAIGAFFPTALASYSFLVFNLLCAPCFAAIGAIKREMNNGKWTFFAIAYQTLFAYAISLMVFQFGTLFTGGGFGVGTVFAVAVLAVFVFLLFRPGSKKNQLHKAAAQNL